MRTPSAAELIRIWELGQGRGTWFRGLLLLAPLFPNRSLRELGATALGTRNARLLELRAQIFGPTVEAIVNCPACTVAIEFSMAIETMLEQHAEDCDSVYSFPLSFDLDGSEIVCRLLCSDDLQALEHAKSASVLASLGTRAAVQIPEALDVTNVLFEKIADAVLTADPLADIRFGVSCSDCGHEWSVDFDAVSFLWKEIEAEVARLFDDVHRLSAAYGWSEAIILAMSAHRRRQYLERT